MRKITTLLAASLVALLTLSACGAGTPPSIPTNPPATPTSPPPPTPTTAPQATPTTPAGMTPGVAPVDTVEIRILESMPVQVQVVVNGYLPTPCYQISGIAQTRIGNNFNITIATLTETNKACIEVIVPYTETISLDVLGLSAGTYTVDVNGVTETFELTADNVAP